VTERVLPTLNEDGSRRWIRPKLSRGPWWKRRLLVGWSLIVVFTLIPYLKMRGKPLILLDVPHRQFTLFGTTFLPTDSMFLMLLLVGLFVGIFLVTAILGRVWCGWACPQTVYMEFVYRPLERLIEGNRGRQMKLDREGPDGRRVVKNVVFGFVSILLAHTFLAYFVGVSALFGWMTGPPSQHWGAFLVAAGVAALMFLDFGVLREQVCLVACPYGRFQSVLLDRRSLIVGYDARRGEPRGPMRDRKDATPSHGDCIDCAACVITCPTGIDIRDGLQMECIHCTQCIDACDVVMEKTGRPRGLIRYGARDELEGKPRRILRPRIVIYPLIMVLVWGGLVYALAHRGSADVTVLRGIGAPYGVLPDGRISNQLRVKIVNRSQETRRYAISIKDAPDLALASPDNPLEVGPGASATASVFVMAESRSFPRGLREIDVLVSDGIGFERATHYRLLGPEE
jgi:cytochrome c oxidase accessory protein FixG